MSPVLEFQVDGYHFSILPVEDPRPRSSFDFTLPDIHYRAQARWLNNSAYLPAQNDPQKALESLIEYPLFANCRRAILGAAKAALDTKKIPKTGISYSHSLIEDGDIQCL